MEPIHPDYAVTLAAAGRRLKLAVLLLGCCWWLTVCLGLWLAFLVLDSVLNLPAGLRLPCALGGAAFGGVCLFRRVVRPALRRQTPERTARMLEQRYDLADNLLINAVQFGRQELRPEERPFARQIVARSAQQVGRIRLADLWSWPQVAPWAAGGGAVLLACLLFAALFPRQFSRAGTRLLLPLRDVPPAGTVNLQVSPGADVTLAEGEDLCVSVRVDRPLPLGAAPTLVWQEKADFIPPAASAGEPAPLQAQEEPSLCWSHGFVGVRVPFAFRVFAGDTYSRSIQVKVRPLPRLRESIFRITPPAYTGRPAQTAPGPPADLVVLPGSSVSLELALDQEAPGLSYADAAQTNAFSRGGQRWQSTLNISAGGVYEIRMRNAPDAPFVTLASGGIRLLADTPPEVEFLTDDRNRRVQYGSRLKLELAARDDFGLQAVYLAVRPVEDESAVAGLKRWNYLGPPGHPGPVREAYELEIDPAHFVAGQTYCLEALAFDFRPASPPGRSRPILLRLKSDDEIALDPEDALAGAFVQLKRTIAGQEKANFLTANLKTYLADALQKRTVPEHRRSMRDQQLATRDMGRGALGEFRRVPAGREYAPALEPLVEREMTQTAEGIGRLDPGSTQGLERDLAALEKQQIRVLTGLLGLLGRLAEQRDPAKAETAAKAAQNAPLTGAEQTARETLDDLKEFVAAQERVLERTKSLLDKGPQDLAQNAEEVLGELAREEEKWAKFLEERLTDFSKLPQQDFADTSLARELNQVFQEIQAADKALTEKHIELAVPHEQSGLENARELIHNLERWLPDTPDNIAWSMEEPLSPTDIALAELPSELEDIVGDLLDKEEEMTADVEDVSSSWLDSLDKGAGWDAMDGPISSMSARGVTGNRLPNQMEIGGRAGEGRTGRSHGQMAADTAEGKGGRETPTRVSPSPFEGGAVKDSSKEDSGGATGGGKLSGASEEGLRGPTPSTLNPKLPRLADRQARVRQEAEALALRLRRARVPTGDVEGAANAMRGLEQAAQKGDGMAVRRAFNAAVDNLGSAKRVLKAEAATQRERIKLPPWMRNEIRLGVQEGIPQGYEEMTSEYYRALAEGRQ